MKALLLIASLLPVLAFGQGKAPGGKGGGVCTLSPTTNATATYFRATATLTAGFSVDAVLACAMDLGPGGRNCLGTNLDGDLLIGPADGGSGTNVRVSGSIFALNLSLVNGNLSLVNNAWIDNAQPGKPVYVTEEEGLSINNTTPIKGDVIGAVTVDFPSFTGCSDQTVTLTGAATSDTVAWNADFELPAGVLPGNARVTGSNSVKVTLCNVTGGALDPASGAFRFWLVR